MLGVKIAHAGIEWLKEGGSMPCQVEGCKCQATDGQYCSEACKESNDHGHCHSGHTACSS
jgi:hypothetical protein